MILSVAFGYLALVAVRNVNLFALVAGFVMAWNLGEWAFELTIATRGMCGGADGRWCSPGFIAQGGLAVLVGLWIVAIASGGFFRSTGEVRRFGLGESAAGLCARGGEIRRSTRHARAGACARPAPGRRLPLPQRPGAQAFIDGRLEVPSRTTFETFVRLGSLLNEGQNRMGRGRAADGRPADPARPR